VISTFTPTDPILFAHSNSTTLVLVSQTQAQTDTMTVPLPHEASGLACGDHFLVLSFWVTREVVVYSYRFEILHIETLEVKAPPVSL
jgi:hypothetical protein